MSQEIIGLDRFSADELRRLRKKVDTLSGDGVTNHPEYITISNPQRRPPPRAPATVSPVALVKVTGNAAGGGKYDGVIWGFPSVTTISPDTTLTTAELGQEGDEVLILNAAEDGEVTHDLTEGTPKVSVFLGYRHPWLITDEETPRPVYIINGIDWEDCT